MDKENENLMINVELRKLEKVYGDIHMIGCHLQDSGHGAMASRVFLLYEYIASDLMGIKNNQDEES